MNKMIEDFTRYINAIYPVSDKIALMLFDQMKLLSYDKREILIWENEKKKQAYFLISGFAKAYSLNEGKEQIAWFVTPGHFVFPSLNSRLQERSRVNVETMYPSQFLCISYEKLEFMFSHSLELSNWGRSYVQKSLSELEDYFSSDFFLNASDQYEKILIENPELLQKVSLKQLASFLNITPESLSRIRAKVKRSKG